MKYGRLHFPLLLVLSLKLFFPVELYAFSDSGQEIGSSNILSSAIGDAEGDGDADLFLGIMSLDDRLYLNAGGTFSDSGQSLHAGDTAALSVFDADGDGDLDVAAGDLSSDGSLWLNDGTGDFTDSGAAVGNRTYFFLAADIDGDGDYDLVEGTDGTIDNRVWKNDGAGVFSDTGQALDSTETSTVIGNDVDGDGDTDLVTAVFGGQANKIWLNGGTGVFTDSGQSLGSADSSSLAVFDFDADGDADIYAGNVNASNTVWLNNGSGTFSDSGQELEAASTYELAGADIDGDGDYDVVAGNGDPVNGASNTIWLNNGNAVFSDSGEEIGDNDSFALSAADFDADGDIDLYDGDLLASGTIFWNDSDHANSTPAAPSLTDEPDIISFSATASVTLEWTAGSDAETTDTDLLTYDLQIGTSPGACDVYCGTFPTVGTTPYFSSTPGNTGATLSYTFSLPRDTYYWSVRTVDTTFKYSAWSTGDSFTIKDAFRNPGQTFDGDQSYAVNPLDADGDGDLDFIETIFANDNRLWRNDGTGYFTQVTQTWNNINEIDGCVADIDGDGDVDYISSNTSGQSNWLWKNDGSGAFSSTGETLGSNWTYDCETADFDSDGDYDVVEAVENGDPNKLYLNDGTGSFTDTGQSMGAEYSMEVAVNDFDGDGDADVVFANRYDPSQVWLNDGAGGLTDSGQSLGSDESRSVFNGDVDADGDYDIIIGYNSASDRVFINNGSGVFSDSGEEILSDQSRSIHAVDVDVDGDNDIIAVAYNQSGQVWINDGAGNFNDSLMRLGGGQNQSMFAADFDNDGDADFVVSRTSYQGCVFWENILDPANTAPAAPSPAPQPDDSIPAPVAVTFNWSAGSDTETPDTDMLTYDIRIGTTSGGCEFFCSSLPWSGATPWKNTGPGALGSADSYTVTMSTGTYYWSMRTVDPAGLAGSWSTEDSFMLMVEETESPTVTDNQSGDDTWRNSAGTTYDVDFYDTGGSFLDNVQYTIWSGTGMTGVELLAWTDIADGINSNSYTTDWQIDFDSATSGLNYVSARAFDNYGNMSAVATDVFHVGKDLTAPTVTDNQAGDDTWRNSAGTAYDVDFHDTGGSDLNNLQYTVYSETGMGGSQIVSWTNIASGVDSASYTADWQINFSAAQSGTNCVSVRAYDNAGNVSAVATDVFYLKKDDEAPTVGDYVSGDDNWYANDPGAIYNVDFYDSGGSKLSAVYYFGFTNTATGTFNLPYTTIASAIDSDAYTDNWGVDFDALPNGTFNVFVRAEDNAGNSVEPGGSVFYVRKTTVAMRLKSMLAEMNATTDIKAADLDGDGDLDIVEGNSGQTNMIWLNNGSGGFSQAVSNLGSYNTKTVFIADMDNDGDLDVAGGNADSGDVRNRVWFNDGSASFTGAGLNYGIGSGNTYSLFMADLDRDGDMDMIAGNYAQSNKVWLNDGTGYYDDSGLSLGSANTNSVYGADVDADADIDIIAGNNGTNKVWLNDGAAAFTDSGENMGIANTKHIFGVDLDGDRDVDIIESNYGDDEIWINDGSGAFTDSGQAISTQFTDAFAAGDMDGDGDTDYYYGRSDHEAVMLNDGTGVFSWDAQSMLTTDVIAAAVFDMDGDGDLDLFSGRNSSKNAIWENRTDFTNTAPAAPALAGEPTQQLASEDNVDVTLEWGDGSDAETVDTDLLTYDVRVGVTGGGCEIFCGWFPAGDTSPGDRPGVAGATNGIRLSLPPGNYYWSVRTVDSTFKSSVWATEDSFSLQPPIFLSTGDGMGGANTYDVDAADMDGDGDHDLFLSAFSGDSALYINDSAASFTDSGQSFTMEYAFSSEIFDVDNDGDLDIVTANTTAGGNVVLINDGSGAFTESGQTLNNINVLDIASGDYDADGDVDFIEGNGSGSPDYVWLNNGDGLYSKSSQAIGSSNAQAVETVDIDNDGDLDYIAGNTGSSKVIWANDGFAGFSVLQTLNSTALNDMRCSDLDGDGDADAVECISSADCRVWKNDGSGTLTDSGQSLSGGNVKSVSITDFDGDGDNDFVTVNGGGEGGRLWFNDGSAVFSDSMQSMGSADSEALYAADLDGDGDMDFAEAVSSGGSNSVWLNQLDYANTDPSAPSITDEPDYRLNYATETITLEWSAGSDDETTDADLLSYDIRIGTMSGGCEIYCGLFPGSGSSPWLGARPGNSGHTLTHDITMTDGTYYWSVRTVDSSFRAGDWSSEDSFTLTRPVFVDSGQENGGSDNTAGLCAADFNGDGYLDYVEANKFSNDLVYLNNGDGTFTDTGQGMNSSGSYDVECADMDGDNDIDYVVLTLMNNFQVWLNDGTGAFAQDNTYGVEFASAVAVGDLDNDGDIDIVAGVNDGGNGIFRNNGDGGFEDSGQSLGSYNTLDVHVADMDGDGDRDIYESNDGEGNRIWFNDGASVFAEGGQSIGADATRQSHDVDVDGDGDLDVVEANESNTPNRIRRNAGDGSMYGTGGEHGSGDTISVYPGDIDGDGDYDFVTGNSLQGNKVWFNALGAFSDAGNSFGSSSTTVVVLADVDADGGLDYIEGIDGAPNRVWLNNLAVANTYPSPPSITSEPNYEITEATMTVTLEWPEGSDAETVSPGLLTYEVRVGDASGGCELFCDVLDAGQPAGPGSGPGFFGPLNSLSLTFGPGDYYWSVRTVDTTYNRSVWSVEDSFNITTDTTPPLQISTVSDGPGADVDFSASTNTYYANWSEATDGETSIARYWYSIGTSSGASDTVEWTDIDAATSAVVTGLDLEGGQTYFFSVKAQNGAGLIGSPATSDGVLIDDTPPQAVSSVYDGESGDIDFSSSSSRLAAGWASSADPETGIAAYWYSAGTSPGASDTVAWTSAAASTSVTISGLSLTGGQTYYFSVKAENGVGTFSEEATSDGVTVDITPPGAPAPVRDGTGDDIDFSTATSLLSANWSAAIDSESGVLAYYYSIGTSAGASDVVSWTDNSSGTSVTHTGLSLSDGQTYYFNVKAINNAGLFSSDTVSDGITINVSGPAEVTGLTADASLSEIQLSWSNPADDDFAGTLVVRDHTGFPGAPASGTLVCDEAENEYCTDSTDLIQGREYYYAAFAYDDMGNYSTASGDGARATAALVTPGFTIYTGWNAVGISMDEVYIDPDEAFTSGDYTIVRADGPVDGYDHFITATDMFQLDYAGGYWIYSSGDIGVVEYIGGNPQAQSSYGIELNAGWSMFSLPYDNVIPWNDTNASLECGGSGAALPAVYYYDNTESAYSRIKANAGTKLLPWKGYWISVDESCTLTLNKPE